MSRYLVETLAHETKGDTSFKVKQKNGTQKEYKCLQDLLDELGPVKVDKLLGKKNGKNNIVRVRR